MDWLINLFTTTDSVAHIVLLYAIVIAVGVYLGKIKIGGISIGVTFVLFAGIAAGHIGFTAPTNILSFLQEFGLILFVFMIGLQVGPGFLESFRKGGITLNLLSTVMVVLNVIVMFACYYIFFDTSDPKNLPMMVGTLYGAVTNTPGLGAANETLYSIFDKGEVPQIASGYACAYPLGVLGIIGATIAIKYIFGIKLEKEEEELAKEEEDNDDVKPHFMDLEVTNLYLEGKTLAQVHNFLNRDFVCSRILHDGHVSIPNGSTIFHIGDKLFVVCAENDAEAIIAFIGPTINVDWKKQDEPPMVSKRILVTRSSINGKTLGQMHFSSAYGVNVTRVTRQGMDLFAIPSLSLQVGDRIMVVGPEDAVNRVAAVMGNSIKRLDAPNIATIFVGVFIGILFGSIPVAIPGIPVPIKLGIAGGPLIIATILIGRYGYKVHLVTYTTTSANMMLREIGLMLFLASVGIKAGDGFLETVIQGDGVKYVYTGFLITIIPILIIGIIARKKYKFNYFTIMGMIAGTYTDPPALAYANSICSKEAPSIGYSTVYPLSMFLRIFTAQIIVLFFCGI